MAESEALGREFQAQAQGSLVELGRAYQGRRAGRSA